MSALFGKRSTELPLESDSSSMHPLISWRSTIAGLLIAFLVMAGLVGLGLAFGGIGLDDGTTARNASIFTGVWFVFSSIISIFVGSYFAARVSKFQTGRIGSAQGLVICSIFLGFFMYQTVMTVGSAGRAAGGMLGGTASFLGSSTERLAKSPMVNNIVEDAIGDLKLKVSPRIVVSGLASRLIRGDIEGAKNFLSTQAGISQAEANSRISTVRAKVDDVIVEARMGIAGALKSAGWSLFFLVLLGSAAAVGGGALGSVANFRKPLSRHEFIPQHA